MTLSRQSRTKSRLAPKSEALAYRIWAYCEPREWHVTRSEVADALGVSWRRVHTVALYKGWSSRFRCESAPKRIGPFKDVRYVPWRLSAEEARIELGVEVFE